MITGGIGRIIFTLPGEFDFPVEKEFHNTIKAEGEKLEQRTSDAKKQRIKVMEFYKLHPDCVFTPFEVHTHLGYENTKTPVSSIRRAMTNLTKKDGTGFLIKTDEQKPERLGAPNYLWKLNKDFTDGK